MQTSPIIRVSVPDQRLELVAEGEVVASYPISTSRFGLGFEEGSFKTPLGRFTVGEKIGDGAPAGTIFRHRVALAPGEPPPPTEDRILSRILWLHGAEEANANTRVRFIYIHGTNHEDAIGQPASHGCIRMKSRDVIALFEQVAVGTQVVITA
jgi:L,D-transpeptidase YbiS